MRLTISEVLKLANSKSKIEERVAILEQNDSYPLWLVLRYCFSPKITWLIPEFNYEVRQTIDQEGNFFNKARSLYLFVDGDEKSNLNIEESKRLALFVQFLEGIDSEDAKLILSISKKVMPYKNINEKVALMAYPGLYND